MKKNVMMRVASALLVAVLMTTCAISGTFAKYTTTASGSDSARVAKWGVEIVANGEMFTTSEDGTTFTGKTVLSAADDEDVVAPGMSGNLVAMEITGEPEVAVEVKYEATLTLENWAVEGDSFYCPIVITVNGTPYNGLAYDTKDAFVAAVVNAINSNTAEYEAGTDLSSAVAPVVSWTWEFSTSAENDENDTKLGNAATAATIALEIVTTITQIDK